MFTKAAIQHLRLRFSLLLMPVFWLALWQINTYTSGLEWSNGIAVLGILFVSLHLFIYPASNAYNSYQDQDIGSIGDIKKPLKATKDVFQIAILFSLLGILTAYFGVDYFYGKLASIPVLLYFLTYVIFSQLYSWRKVRLKQYPFLGFLIIFLFQGTWIVNAVTAPFAISCLPTFPYLGNVGLSASFMFGGGYPITQIYQHKQDKEDGVKTISMLLGIKGTLIFSGIMNAIGLALLASVVIPLQGISTMLLYLLILAPSFYYFSKWAAKVFKDESEANFENVMRMTWISAICNNIAILMLILLPPIKHWLQ